MPAPAGGAGDGNRGDGQSPAVIPSGGLPALERHSPGNARDGRAEPPGEPGGWDNLTEDAQGIVSLQQAQAAGIARKKLHQQARTGKGQRVHRGVYATYPGELTRTARLRAAIIRAGPGAMLSHETAAEVQGLISQPSSIIHVTVPTRRRPAQRSEIAGVVIHRSDQAEADLVPYPELPRTRLIDTVLDLVACAGSFDEACAWIARAVSLPGPAALTTADIARAMAARTRMRRRKLLEEVLGAPGDGAQFPLERHYAKLMIRAHGLPAATRPVSRPDARMWRLGLAYAAYQVVVELDGVIGNAPAPRAPVPGSQGDTIRLTWPDVIDRGCDNSARLARMLIGRRWDAATLRPCRDGCAVARVSPSPGRP